MSPELALKMYIERNRFDPPLTVREIMDFANHNTDTRSDAEKLKEILIIMEEHEHKYDPKNFKTKKELRLGIKSINREIEDWMELKRRGMSFSHEGHIDELVMKKERLQKRLKFDGQLIKTEDLKKIPITNFIEFNCAKFAKCIFHEDKTPSMKYYPEDNKVHCFGCGQHADVIAVVQQLNKCSFREAIKILRK